MAKKNTKVDITFDKLVEEGTNIEEMSELEQAKLHYETALRYVDIAQHMKQFEDQDKYYDRASRYLRKARAADPSLNTKEFKKLLKTVRLRKFAARAEGKIALYKEACHIRDTAKTPNDYLSAQNLFERIHAYEKNHQLNEKFTNPETFAEASECNDSEAQAKYCAKKAAEKESQQRRHSLVVSLIFIACIGAFLFFTRTLAFQWFLASVNAATGDHNGAWHYYLNVYYSDKATDDDKAKALELYEHHRYTAADKALADGHEGTAYNDFKVLAKLNYMDSRNRFTALEKQRLVSSEVGQKIGFARMDWLVLEKTDDKILLFKSKAKGSVPFNETAPGNTSWENSSARQYLNTTFIEENYYDQESSLILDTEVPSAKSVVTGKRAGKATTDKLFLLTAKDVEKYSDVIPKKTSSCWWLRTPGAYPDTMCFVNTDQTVMDQGYLVTTPQITLKPAMWINLK